ncbi:helix-turn-helix transcriptional regulator [Halomonas getboli]|uniref:helix-turn-helix transcriptional regulator n=1 Tax=Halomonas getboli TaxID=2935862 RepID=UPI001FFEE1AA|nr:helix-turn-helix transcriptional regulator [Halomonas getboli]MCK2182951.1 helix-turn-helix transcriptional regulator [Halomonas getboli]
MCQDMMRAEIWLQDTMGSQEGIDALARKMGYSSSQIRRRFRNYFGLSPGAYRDRLRLEKAARLLIHTSSNINQIAGSCGYQNHSAFSRAFQRHYGQPPRRYRQSLRTTLKRQLNEVADFSYQIRELPPRKAVLTRLYRPSRIRDDLRDWLRRTPGAEALPARLEKATPLAIVHDRPLEGALPRLDLGMQLKAGSTTLALPPAFRLLDMPAERHACVILEHVSQLDAAVLYMACRGVSGHGEALSGAPPLLLQNHDRLELHLPLS